MFDFIYHRGPLVIHVPLGQTAYRAVETTAIPEDRDAVKLKSLKYFLFKIIFDGWNFDSNMKNYILHLGYSFKKKPIDLFNIFMYWRIRIIQIPKKIASFNQCFPWCCFHLHPWWITGRCYPREVCQILNHCFIFMNVKFKELYYLTLWVE